jgi:hypothetical protein
VVAVVSTAATVATEVQSAQAQNKAIGQGLNTQNAQVKGQEVSAVTDRAREARKEQGRMAVAAGESGLQLSSGSVESQLLDSAMQQKLANESIHTNADYQRQAATAQANSQYSQVQSPSIIGAGLRLVGAGVSGYAQGHTADLSKLAVSRKAADTVTR